MLALKNRPQHLVVTAVVSSKEQKVRYHSLGGSAKEEWVFTPTRVYKLNSTDETVLSSLENPRASFSGHELDSHWDEFQFIYFCGYALWQYFNFPYLLARDDVKAREFATHCEAGQTWRVLEVMSPDPYIFSLHSRMQKHYFNEAFILQRHDYAPDVVASSPAVYYLYDPVALNGITFPTLRRVVAGTQGDSGIYVPMTHGTIPTLIHLVFLKIELAKGEVSEPEEGHIWAKQKPN
ncbi:hypothetical protein THAR02_10914 [Trichoderma harzianum]|uniref:Uncharacterized protein n=1 Tax=Trichoderma harzianum TaxID=5544 RepID=A0A0F9WWW7_TRIHA|nr:hypothetical protein THAR02_10914 [Trichoderma harzianum]